MPSRFGFEVVIVDGNEGIPDSQREAFLEYGTKIVEPTKLSVSGSGRDNESSKGLVTTKIECKSDQKFFIRMRPEGGWPDMEDLKAYDNPPYVFSVAVYIDGNPKAELDVMLLELDPARYTQTRGQYYKGRTVIVGHDPTGKVRVQSQGWKFTELGIEVQMDRLHLDAPEATRNDSSEREPNHNQVGQIAVKITRCVPTGKSHNLSNKIIGSAEVTELTTVGQDATHHAQLNTSFQQDRIVDAVATKAYNPGEGVWATFIFQNMDRKKLEKLGLCDKDGRPVIAAATRGRGLHSPEAVVDSSKAAHKRKADGDLKGLVSLAFRPKPDE